MNENPTAYKSTEERMWDRDYQEARKLSAEILDELARIKDNKGITVADDLFHEICHPPGFNGVTLKDFAVYHAIIMSTTKYEKTPQFDIQEGKTLMDFFRQKLKELKQM